MKLSTPFVRVSVHKSPHKNGDAASTGSFSFCSPHEMIKTSSNAARPALFCNRFFVFFIVPLLLRAVATGHLIKYYKKIFFAIKTMLQVMNSVFKLIFCAGNNMKSLYFFLIAVSSWINLKFNVRNKIKEVLLPY